MVIYCGTIIAQDQLENPGFEEWENIGVSATDTIREPVEWSSLKTSDAPELSTFAPVVCKRSSEAHSGDYSMKLTNVSSLLVANGIATNGRIHPDLNTALAYTFTDTDNEEWHTSFTSRPDSIVGWYMYAPQGGDSLQVKVNLHRGYGKQPDDNWEENWIGVAEFKAGDYTGGEWVRFSVPVTYLSDADPEFVLVVMSSGNAYAAVANSVAHFDDLEMIYNSTYAGVKYEKAAGYIALNGPRTLWIRDMDIADFDHIRVFNVTGKQVWESRIDSERINISQASLPQGIYIVTLNGSKKIFTQKVLLR